MITNDRELEATQERIRHFQAQVVHLRKVETNPLAYRLSVSGFLAEIDRMQLEVRGSEKVSGTVQTSCLNGS